jgi:MFS transporter, DHA1 family, tetracycline resistance protein
MIASEVSSFFFSPIVPVISQAYGRKTIITIGYIAGVLSICALACTYYLDDPTTYVWVAIVCRLFQGIGD